ncbi:MAG: hypothetical protein WC894_01570 [Patescibacteria group bacterium]
MRITKNISVSPERVVQYAITATYLSMLLSCKGQSGPDALQTVTPDINAINSLRQRAIDTLGQDAKYLGEPLSSFKVDIPAEPDRSKPASTVSGTIFEIKSESSVMLEANNLTLGLYVPDPNKDPNVNTDPIPVLINHISENPDSLIQTTVEDDNGIKVERYGIAAMPLDEQYLDAFMHGDASVNGPVDKFLKKNANGDVVPLYSILFNDITKDNVGDFVKELSQLNNPKDIQEAVLSHIYGITFTDFDNDRSIIIKLNNENQKNIKDFIANLFFGSDMVAQAKGLSAEELTAQAASPTPSVLPSAIPSTPTEAPATATAEATAMVPVVNISETFKDNKPFYTELIKQDKNASKDIQERGDNVTLTTADGKQYEVDKKTGGVNVDVNGNPLLVEDTGYVNPLTLHGKAGTENEGKVFAFNPEYKGWFEVIQSNHPVDQKASEEDKMKQREVAINDPVKVTVEQVQNGDWAESVLLSGLVKPFPADWKFAGNAVYHGIKDPSTGGEVYFLYTSDRIPIDFFGVVKVGNKNIGLRPFQVWNPTDVIDNPNSSEILIANIGIGAERLTEEQNSVYLSELYKPDGVKPIIVILSDKAATQGSGPFLEQQSILALKQIPGNDPLTIFFIKQKVDRLIGKDQLAIVSQSSLDLINIQKLIWLAYFP